jgi:hypothetical protein
MYYGSLLHGWDAQLYYAAAHSFVFDRDVDITNDIALTPYTPPFEPDANGFFRNIPRRSDGRVLNFYPAGLPLVESVGLVLGSGIRSLAEGVGYHVAGPPGYSSLEINTVAVWLLAAFAFGMHVLYALLGSHSTLLWRVLCMAAAWAGTSLLYYSAVFPFMGHAQSFVLIVCISWLAVRLPRVTPTNRAIALIGFCTTLLYLVRPQQVLFTLLLIPANLALVRRPWKDWLPGTVVGLTIALLGFSFQTAIHTVNLEHFSISGRDFSHPHPAVSIHFRWLEPHFRLVLLSPARGLFFITPAFALGLAGSLLALRQPGNELSVLYRVFPLHLSTQLYLIACLSDPSQADSFGIRMFCECAPLVALGLLALYRPRPAVWIPLALLTGACIAWTCLLMVVFIRRGLAIESSHAEVFYEVMKLFHLRT